MLAHRSDVALIGMLAALHAQCLATFTLMEGIGFEPLALMRTEIARSDEQLVISDACILLLS